MAFSSYAIDPTPDEMTAIRQWAESTFSTDAPGTQTFIEIRHQDVAEAITRGRSWRGTPFQIGEKTYRHGIAFNATKHLVIRASNGARRFQADVGLESNDDTLRGEGMGQGSVVFTVLASGKEVFRSPVLRRRDGPVKVDVDLKGASEFQIRVGDAGDGRGWDQALWGEATVTLADGRVLRLQDLPVGQPSPGIPFSFRRGGVPSAEFAARMTRRSTELPLTNGKRGRELVLSTSGDGLETKVEVEFFEDFPAIEWLVRFTNRGEKDTPILEEIAALDTVLPVHTAGAGQLHWSKGAVASFDDFAPQTVTLQTGARHTLRAGDGRSSSQVLPFFNIEGAGVGAIVALGWSGTWAMEIAHHAQGQLAMKAGMERTHLVLHPGESIRTPRMLVLYYEGDRWRGQNLLRRFLLKHHRPAPKGQPLVAPITCGNWGGTRAQVHLDNIRTIERERLPIAYYWIDAEWYGPGPWPVSVGDWRVKSQLYPESFKPLSETLRKTGRELMLWFEPERVYKGTPWHREHPQWLIDIGRDSLLWNLGNPEACRFLTEFISSKIQEFGLGCYRQDFNMDPAPYWKAADATNRVGMAEIRHIEGLYAFWDGLLERNPGLILDNCASGGRRIDLETVGRATPFWRTDGPRDAIAHQCHTFGLLPWVPLSATSQDRAGDDYEFRSSMCSALCLNWWVSGDVPAEGIRPDFPFPWARRTLERYLEIRDNYYGDFYPLTTHSKTPDAWLAYQLDRPESGNGMVVVLRRPDSPYDSARFPLRELEAGATYTVKDLDEKTSATAIPGKQLTGEGLRVEIASKPGSAVLIYEKR